MNQWQKDAISNFRFLVNALKANGMTVSPERQAETERLVKLTGGLKDRDELINLLVQQCVFMSMLDYDNAQTEYMKTNKEWDVMFESIRENALKEA